LDKIPPLQQELIPHQVHLALLQQVAGFSGIIRVKLKQGLSVINHQQALQNLQLEVYSARVNNKRRLLDSHRILLYKVEDYLAIKPNLLSLWVQASLHNSSNQLRRHHSPRNFTT